MKSSFHVGWALRRALPLIHISDPAAAALVLFVLQFGIEFQILPAAPPSSSCVLLALE